MVPLFCFFCLFYGCFGFSCYQQSINKQRLIEIRDCLSKLNAEEFSAKQVTWKLGTHSAWLQLDLNYVFGQQGAMQPNIVMNPQQQGMMMQQQQMMMMGQPGMMGQGGMFQPQVQNQQYQPPIMNVNVNRGA